MNASGKTMHGSNAWLQNAFNVHVNLEKQSDGTYTAKGGSLSANGKTEEEATRLLRSQLHNSALKGDL